MEIRFHPLGDLGLRVEFGQEIRPEIHQTIRRFCAALAHHQIPGVVEWAPAYTTVAVYYHPHRIRYQELCARLEEIQSRGADVPLPPARLVEIPVLYGGAAGPDLEALAAGHAMAPEEVVARHTAPVYLVQMLGFLPGFPYLAGLPESLETPRRATPRPRVPAGSVAIGGAQTGIYPLEAPGGWHLIGRTPAPLYEITRQPAALLQAGDRLRFISVEEDTYAALGRQRAEGLSVVTMLPWEEESADAAG